MSKWYLFHPIFSLYVALHYGSKALHTELWGKNGGFMCICTIYYTHLSSWMCSSQQEEGGVCSQTKFSSHPQKKGQVQRSASFWNCVIYAWHTLNMILSLFIRKIPLLLFYSPKFLEALLAIVLRNLLVMLFHTWFPQKTIRSETKLVLLTAKKISWQRLVNRAKQWILQNIWLITTSVDTLMIVVIYNVTGWRRIYIHICQGGFLEKA